MALKIFSLCFLIIYLTACNSSNPNNKKETEDDFPEFSQEELQQMIQNSPQAQMQLGQAQANSNDLIQKMEELLQKDSDNLDHNYNLAKLYYQKYMQDSSSATIQKAIPLYSKVIQLDPNYQQGKAYYNRMLCYLQNKDFAAALQDINQFEKINQGQTPVNYWAMRAEIHYQQQDKTAACAEWAKALAAWQKDSLPFDNEETWRERCK